ncbi:hypothetical protein G7Y89_g3616 [Cudoniella acicularis]|uniref:Uncharacterized protein n=1 Tax=Cudoniella acicularis TaxID=354080 RepID=A0A8H4RSW9_9HELO|nr:hypothetical protein G7Y89_g3616 [Cudoniella acicularis]
MRREVNNAWKDRHKSRYKNVKVLLTNWDSEDLGVCKEVQPLEQVFAELYHFDASKYYIPDQQPTTALYDRVRKFINNVAPDVLLIFYYAGHGSIDEARINASVGGNKSVVQRFPPALSNLFSKKRLSAVALSHDACSSADTAYTKPSYHYSPNKSITELVAACRFDNTALGVGQNSLTAAPIEVLRDLFKKEIVFSISVLHNKVLAKLRNTRPRSKKATPVHNTLTSEKSGRRIVLEKLSVTNLKGTNQKSSISSIDTKSTMVSFKVLSSIDEEACRKWVPNAHAQILGIDFEAPYIGGDLDKWRCERNDERSKLQQEADEKSKQIKIKIETSGK